MDKKLVAQAVADAHEVASSLAQHKSSPDFQLIQLIERKLDIVLTQLGASGPTKSNEELHEEYVEHVRARNAPGTLSAKKYLIRQYIRFLKDKPLAEVSFKDIRRFVDDYLVGKKVRVSTIDSYLAYIRGFHRFLNRYYGYEIPDSSDICAREYEGRVLETHVREPLSREEIRKLIHSARGVLDKLAIGMLYYGGLRASELTDLKLEDVDVEKGVIRVVRGKGGKSRWAKYPPNQLNMLVDLWLRKERKSHLNSTDNDYFFVSRSGNKLNKNSLRILVHEAAERAGIQEIIGKRAISEGFSSESPIYRVTPHILRHSFATHANEDGVKFEVIQRLMGHASPGMTMHYAKQSPKSMFESYDASFQGISTKRKRKREKVST